jgi:hypothetical protein
MVEKRGKNREKVRWSIAILWMGGWRVSIEAGRSDLRLTLVHNIEFEAIRRFVPLKLAIFPSN